MQFNFGFVGKAAEKNKHQEEEEEEEEEEGAPNIKPNLKAYLWSPNRQVVTRKRRRMRKRRL